MISITVFLLETMSLDVNISESDAASGEIHTFIKEIALFKGIEDFVYTVESVNGNFIANIYNVVIKDNNKEVNKTVSVVLKTLVNSIRQELFHAIHKRECIAYEKVISQIKTKSKDSKLYLPECLLSSQDNNKEVIILEQLKDKGFEECRLNRYIMFDLDHFIIVFSELAKFHAASFILKVKEPDLFKQLTEEFRDVMFEETFLNKTKLRNYYIDSFKRSIKEVKAIEAKNKLERIEKNLIEIVRGYLKPVKHSVLCHGDLWMRNIMFQYEEESPSKVCFIDFQAMRYASPITDIFYFLYLNTTDAKFRSEHFTDLSNIYHDNMTEFLKLHDINTEEVYPRTQFDKDLVGYKAYGFLITLIQLKAITLTPENEAIDHGSKLIGHGDIETVPGENVLFHYRVNDLVNEFVVNGILDEIVNNL